MNMQHLLLLGRSTKDAELIEGKSGRNFSVFSLAVNKYLGKERGEETTYYDCICFLSNADKLAETVKSGDLVFIQGRPTAEAYINKDNEAVGKLKVIIDSWQVVK